MGTTNRSFNRHSRRSAMSNTAKSSRRHQRKEDERTAERRKKASMQRSIFGHINYGIHALLGIFTGFKESLFIPGKPRFYEFTTPTHSPWLKGRRTDEERADRKKRRQKRTKLIMKRGYA